MLSLRVSFGVHMTIAAGVSVAVCVLGPLTCRPGVLTQRPTMEIGGHCPGSTRNGGRDLRSEDENMLGSVSGLCSNRIIPASETPGRATTTIKPVMSDYARRD